MTKIYEVKDAQTIWSEPRLQQAEIERLTEAVKHLQKVEGENELLRSLLKLTEGKLARLKPKRKKRKKLIVKMGKRKKKKK